MTNYQFRNEVYACNSTDHFLYRDTTCQHCQGAGCVYCHGQRFIRMIIAPPDKVFSGNNCVLDTQEQRKSKGANICPHCGCFCATKTEGE